MNGNETKSVFTCMNKMENPPKPSVYFCLNTNSCVRKFAFTMKVDKIKPTQTSIFSANVCYGKNTVWYSRSIKVQVSELECIILKVPQVLYLM